MVVLKESRKVEAVGLPLVCRVVTDKVWSSNKDIEVTQTLSSVGSARYYEIRVMTPDGLRYLKLLKNSGEVSIFNLSGKPLSIR